MKLITSLALFGGTYAFNVDTFVKQAISQIYVPRENGWDISLEPYLKESCDSKTKGDTKTMWSCKGTYGRSAEQQNKFATRVVLDLEQKIFKYDQKESGNTGNLPLESILPETLQGVDYMYKDSINAKWVDISKGSLTASCMSKIGGESAAFMTSLRLKEAGLKRGAYTVKVRNSGKFKNSDGLAQVLNIASLPGKVNWDMKLAANAAQSCLTDPDTSACKVSAAIKGNAGPISLNHKVAYNVLEDGEQFAFTFTRQNLVSVLSITADGITVDVHFQHVEPESAKKLVVRVPCTGALKDMKTEALALYEPFRAYGEAAITDVDTAAHAIVWIDQRFGLLDQEFNCQNLVLASQLESEYLAEFLGWSSVQETLIKACDTANEQIVNFLTGPASAKIEETRDRVHQLTGPAGKATFQKWYDAHIAP